MNNGTLIHNCVFKTVTCMYIYVWIHPETLVIDNTQRI